MRVALITPVFPETPDEPVGGVGAVVSCLAPALKEVRPDLDLQVIRCPEHGRTEPCEDPRGFTVHDVPVPRSAANVVPGLGPARRLEAILRRLAPDVVHVQAAGFYLDARRWPAVMTIHGIMEKDTYYRRGLLRSLLVRLREAPARARYRHVIAIAGYVLEQLRGKLRGRCHFIPNPIEPAFFDVQRREAGPRVLFAGPLIPRKNIHGIVEALGLLHGRGEAFEARFAGPDGPEAYMRQVRARIGELGLTDKVVFLGALGRGALRQEMQQARCLWLPSFQETAPMVIAEAAAMGVPSVTAPAGGCAEMVSHGLSGLLVDPDSPASMADAVAELTREASRADEMGEEARRRAQVHRPDRVARKTLGVYDQVAST